MKRKYQTAIFWVILVVVNIVVFAYAARLCMCISGDDAQTLPWWALLGPIFLVVIVDIVSVLVDYRHWRATTKRRWHMNCREPGVNVEVIICASGRASVTYGEKRKTMVRNEILCDGPTTMLQAGLVRSSHVLGDSWQEEV